MSTALSDRGSPTFAERLRKRRRRIVKQTGKRFIRGLADFIARQSLVGDRAFYEISEFPFLQPLEADWKLVRAELDEIMKLREHVPAFQEVSPDQMRISKGDKWKTYILYGFGKKLEKNCARCPETTRLLEQVPNLETAWFSIMGPRYHIPAHRGVTKTILRCHLGLIVPKEREKCRIRVGDEVRPWEEGRAFVFDDTYDHEVWNDTDDDRVILLFDFDRPMRFWGRVVHRIFVAGLKFTAYYRDPMRNLRGLDERFEAATRRANETLEKLSDPS